MPLIVIKSSAPNVSSQTKEHIHEQAEVALSTILGKSRDYVMSILELDSKMSFAGDAATPTSYIEVKNVGRLDPEITKQLSSEITEIISNNLGIKKERIYIEFQQSDRHLWGWNGKTFA